MAEFQKICVICGREFIAKQVRTSYCSSTCRQTAYRTGKTTIKKNNLKITDEQLSQAIDDGLSRQEIADKYGMHVESIARRMQRIGTYATGGDQFVGIRKNWGKKTENINKGKVFGVCWHYIKSHDDLIKEKHPDFVYLESINKGNTKTVRLKCKKCNNIIERYCYTVRKTKNISCDYCTEKQKQQIELQNERVKLMRFFVALKEYKTPKICKGCGSEYYSQFENSAYCSRECRKKARRTGSGIRSRCRHYGVYYDPAVKPKLVFERDNYICQICGMTTNPDDKSWNGNFGPYSPTVDHILALANGGAHTWENVQCAHAKCNSWKRDLLTV